MPVGSRGSAGPTGRSSDPQRPIGRDQPRTRSTFATDPKRVEPAPVRQADHRVEPRGCGPGAQGPTLELSLEERVLQVAAYWRTNLALRQLTLLFGASKTVAGRTVDRLGTSLALQQRQGIRENTVLLADGALSPTRDHQWASSRRTAAAPPTIRSSSTQAPASSSPSARPCPATATAAMHGSRPEREPPSATPWSSRTAATGAQAWSSRTGARRARPTHGLKRGTQRLPHARSAPASSTPSPA